MEKVALHPLQYLRRSGVSRPYCRKREYRHSCAPCSVQFTVGGCTISHAPVFVAYSKRCGPSTGDPARVSAVAFYALRALRFHTYDIPSRRQAEWSAVRNSSWPLSAATRCPVTTKDAKQFSGDVLVGSRRARPACFTGRRVTPLPGVLSTRPWKGAGTKAPQSACYTRTKAYTMLGVTCCKNDHSCWSDFYSPA